MRWSEGLKRLINRLRSIEYRTQVATHVGVVLVRPGETADEACKRALVEGRAMLGCGVLLLPADMTIAEWEAQSRA